MRFHPAWTLQHFLLSGTASFSHQQTTGDFRSAPLRQSWFWPSFLSVVDSELPIPQLHLYQSSPARPLSPRRISPDYWKPFWICTWRFTKWRQIIMVATGYQNLSAVYYLIIRRMSFWIDALFHLYSCRFMNMQFNPIICLSDSRIKPSESVLTNLTNERIFTNTQLYRTFLGFAAEHPQQTSISVQYMIHRFFDIIHRLFQICNSRGYPSNNFTSANP